MLDRKTIGFVNHFLRTYPRRSAVMVALLIFSGLSEGVGILTLLPALELAADTGGREPSGLSLAVSRALQAMGLPTSLGFLLTLIVIAIALKGGFRWLAMKQVGYTVAQVATDLRLRLIRALMEARWAYFTNRPTGHFANAISTEAHRASTSYRWACFSLAASLQVLVDLTIVFAISWRVALLTVAVGVGMLYTLSRFVTMSRAAGKSQTEVMKRLVARLTQALPAIKPVKAMRREAFLLPVLEQETAGFNRAQQQQVLASEAMYSAKEPILVLFMAGGLFAAVTWANMPLVEVLILAFLFYRSAGQMGLLQNSYREVALGESAFWSLHGLIEEAEAAREYADGKREPPPLRTGIRLKEVGFSYGSKPVLNEVDLFIPSGSFVAVVGPSGAGKTTLADLVVGLHRPHRGRLYLDDVPLDEVDLYKWRSSIGYVPQDALLINDSVYRNVTLGNDAIDRARAQQALEAAGAWGFVSERVGGIDATIGEMGAELSGGQRQRISIARALVGRPRLLILDEATTGLDPVTEAGICETLRRLRGQVTILAISHQPAMRDAADYVYEVVDGRVVDLGGALRVAEEAEVT